MAAAGRYHPADNGCTTALRGGCTSGRHSPLPLPSLPSRSPTTPPPENTTLICQVFDRNFDQDDALQVLQEEEEEDELEEVASPISAYGAVPGDALIGELRLPLKEMAILISGTRVVQQGQAVEAVGHGMGGWAEAMTVGERETMGRRGGC